MNKDGNYKENCFNLSHCTRNSWYDLILNPWSFNADLALANGFISHVFVMRGTPETFGPKVIFEAARELLQMRHTPPRPTTRFF